MTTRKRRRLVPEFEIKTRRPRMGFVPRYDEYEVETWQVWCRKADGEAAEESWRRATSDDLRRAGYVRRKR